MTRERRSTLTLFTRHLSLVAVAALLTATASACQTPLSSTDHFSPPPAVRREFRGVWVATVSNIDWPSKPGLSTQQQKDELIALLDRCAALHFNAVVLQVRPAADALYPSKLEPWSEYLTGVQGKAPSPYWDPLAVAVNEAHKRGLELHVWINPYRARHPSARSPNSSDHISVTHPELVRKYGTHLWMDPGEPAVRAHTLAVVNDIVARYDIDGVHMDDYFYPYSENDASGKKIPFPDSESYARYRNGGGTLERDDWRRENVNQLVHEMYAAIKQAKSWVKFGVSPFGIWRPGYPERIKGFDAYSELFADSRKWLTEGWVDYFTPQIYWAIGKPDERYPLLLHWWAQQNPMHRNMWVGNYPGRVTGKPSGWPAQEIIDQIAMTRAEPGVTGNVHFSMETFTRSADGLSEKLLAGPYNLKALIPPSPWLDDKPPAQPEIKIARDSNGAVSVRLIPRGSERTWLWLVQTWQGTQWQYDILPGDSTSYSIPAVAGATPDLIAVSSIDRLGNESNRAILKIDHR
ncbi:MAG: family 10 glycosylhydrolase [Gemmatimonadota bacterium]|nr:family 10 glycosylhydrolase [Gemmatimonadota bacterium]